MVWRGDLKSCDSWGWVGLWLWLALCLVRRYCALMGGDVDVLRTAIVDGAIDAHYSAKLTRPELSVVTASPALSITLAIILTCFSALIEPLR